MVAKKVPIRQFTGCREMNSNRDIIRDIKTAENEICNDATGRKNGRGAYICPNMVCLKQAMKNRGLERSLKTAIPETVYQQLEEEMSHIDKG